MEIYDENSNHWFTKDRSETASNRVPERKLDNNSTVENLGLGLHVYHNTFSLDDANRYIKTLESNLATGGKYNWSEAQVTNSTVPIKKARDAVDFKYKQENLGPRNETNSELIDLHEEIYQKLKYCIDDYAKYWGINVTYYEAFNFVKYEGAGTVEFLVDKHRNFYFMEMNTRIQVEHPITEQVVDYDLIREQIMVAAGIPISGKNYLPQLHAIECRINAEDPYNDFRPSPGKITTLHAPGGHGVRLDTHVYAGYTIPPNYDSMIAKLITTAQTRQEAINKMKRALDEFVIEGVKTTIPFHRQLMDEEQYVAGNYTTAFMDTFKMNDPE
jgi:hypothetical protein